MLSTNIPQDGITANSENIKPSENDQSPYSNNRDFVAFNATFGTYDTVNFWQHLPPNKIDLDAFTHTVKDGGVTRSKHIIRPNENTTIGISYDHLRQSVLVEVPSLPKLYGKDLAIVAPHDVQNAIDAIIQAIAPFVDIDTTKAVCSRVDPSTAFWMDKDAKQYIDLLHNCTMNKVRHSHKSVYDGETVVMRNKSHSIGFYDKAEKEHLPTSNSGFLRLEAKFMNSQVVAKNLTASKRLILSDLASGHTIRKAVETRSDMVGKYFKLDQVKMKQYQSELDFMTAMKVAGRRSAGLHTIAFAALRNDPSLVNRIKAQMNAAGYNKSTVKRTIDTLNELQLSATDANSLYDELLHHIQSELNEAQRI